MFHKGKTNDRKRKASSNEKDDNASTMTCHLTSDILPIKARKINSNLAAYEKQLKMHTLENDYLLNTSRDNMITLFIRNGIESFSHDNLGMAENMFWGSLALAIQTNQQFLLYQLKKSGSHENIHQYISEVPSTPIANEIRYICNHTNTAASSSNKQEDQHVAINSTLRHGKLLSPPSDISYDEGFCTVSRTPIELRCLTNTKELEVAVILFNLGQVHLKTENHSLALQFFEMAFDSCYNCCKTGLVQISHTCHANSHSTETSIQYSQEFEDVRFRIVQAKAYCCYRLSYYVAAIENLESSLHYVGDNKYYQASTRNSIAVAILAASSSSNKKGMMTSNATKVMLTTKVLPLFHESLRLYESLLKDSSDQRACNALREIATVLNNTGRSYYANGQLDRAVATFERALKARRLPESQCNQMDLIVTICNLGQVYHQIGRLDDARILYQEFLDFATESEQSSNNNPGNRSRCDPADVAVIALHMSYIHLDNEQLQEARSFLEMSLTFNRIANDSTTKLEIASILNKLASVCYKLDDRATSLKYLQEGLMVEESIYGQYHSNVLVTVLNIAQICRDMNNYSEAFRYYDAARNIHCKLHEDQQQQQNSHGNAKQVHVLALSSILFSMALMKSKMKSYSIAFEYYQEALYLQRQHYGDDADHPDIASTLNSAGIVLFHWGKLRLAQHYIEESLAMRKKLFGWYHHDTAINLYNLGTLHKELGNDTLAARYYKETLNVECQTMNKTSRDVIQTLQQLGLLYQQRGELNESLIYFNQALVLERLRSDDDLSVAKLLNLIGNIHLQRGDVRAMMDCFVEATKIFKKHNAALEISGYNFYAISKLHPECAEAA